MPNIKLFATLAVLLSLGIGIACKPPEPPATTQPVDAEKEAKEQADREAEEARRRAAEEEAARRRAAEEEARRRAAEEEAARRRAEEEARAIMLRAAEAALLDVNFDYNRADVRRTDRAKLEAIAAFMNAYPQASVRIEGHCDERGTIEYNMALGERRASAAMAYLVNLGVSASRFSTVSYGKERPKVVGSDERSWLANRRCEFKLQ